MTKLTKEQLEWFNEHFMLTEVTHDVSTYVYATDDLEQLNELNSEEIEKWFYVPQFGTGIIQCSIIRWICD